MQVRGETESAREWRIRPCSSIPRQRARRESVRSFFQNSCDVSLTPSSVLGENNPRPNCPLVLQCGCAVVVFVMLKFPFSISDVAPMSGRMGK